jgi:hypothetical protein
MSSDDARLNQLRAGLIDVAARAAELIAGLAAGASGGLVLPGAPSDSPRCLEIVAAAQRARRALEFHLDAAERRRARSHIEAGMRAFAEGVNRRRNPYGSRATDPDPVAAERWDAGWVMGAHLEANPPPAGTERVTVLPGQTLRGVTHFEGADYCVTPEFADHLIEAGIVVRADPVQRVLDQLSPRWRS